LRIKEQETHLTLQEHDDDDDDKYLINAKYNYCVSDEELYVECDKEENVEVNGAASTSCLKRRL
jgi:hypothetical protein